MDNIKIVDATPQDVFGIRDVQRITWIDTYPNPELGITKEDVESEFSKDDTEEGKRKIESWNKRYSDPNQHRWIAKNGEKIVGFCVAYKEESNNRIWAIYVIPSLQGKGLGRKLMEKALAWLGNDRDIYINLASYNTKALKFYEKFGFIKTGKSAHSRYVEPLPSGKIIPEIETVKKTSFMNINNLHILNGSGTLTQYLGVIETSFIEALEQIRKKINISNIDIVVYDNPDHAIKEIGIGGCAPTPNLIFVSLDPKFPNLAKSIENELKRTLAHELHHCMRQRSVGYGDTLLEALVTEGLADHFNLEVYKGRPHPWDTNLSDEQIKNYLEKAKTKFNDKNYDHNSWFFGSKEENIPRWTGYTLGFTIVKKYLEKNLDKKPSELYSTKAEEFK